LKNDPATGGDFTDIKPLQLYVANTKWKKESTESVEQYIRNILVGNFKIERVYVDSRGYAIVTFADHATAVDAYFLLTEKVSDDVLVNFNRGKKTTRAKKSQNNNKK